MLMQIAELIEIRDAFVQEIELASHGQKTSLPFIKNRLPSQSLVSHRELFQVILVGGTVYQTGLFRFTDQGNELVEQNQGALPLLESKDTFLKFIEGQLNPEVRVVALNFAYPLQPTFIDNRLDGILVWGSKEHKFAGLINHKVGEAVEEYIKQLNGRDIIVSSANDTIALLLSGLTDTPWNELSAGIVGSGINFATFLDEHTAINLESGEFDKFTLSEAATELDRTSAVPGSALLEKETGGTYLFQKFNIMIRQRGIDIPELTKTDQLDPIVMDESHPAHAEAKEVMECSARMVAMQISALMEWHQKNMTFTMAGSMFWKAYQYKEHIERFIKQLSPGYVATFIKNPNAELTGAARLVT